jgi:glycogen synthase kinase 3 beta
MISKLLEYTPNARLSAIQAMVHPFFDELRQEDARMPNGREFPPLFNFTREGEIRTFQVCNVADDGVELSVRPDLIQQLVPPYCEPELASRSIVLDNFVPIPLEQLKITLD